MVFCTNCGEKILEESKFCRECGSELIMSDKEVEIISDVETDLTPDISVDVEEEASPKIYAKSKLIASLCVIGLFPILMNIYMISAICLLVGGVVGLLTHRVRDIGARKFWSFVIILPNAIAVFVGIWAQNSIPGVLILFAALLILVIPFRLGRKS